MSELYIDGIAFTIYIESIKQSSKIIQEIRKYYDSDSFVSGASPDARTVSIAFTIYGVSAEQTARDLEHLFRYRKQFIMWITGKNIINDHEYIIASPNSINIPRDSKAQNLIKGTMTFTVVGIAGVMDYARNNYVRIKYLGNIWDLEGVS